MSVIPTNRAWTRVSNAVKKIEGQSGFKNNQSINRSPALKQQLVQLTSAIGGNSRKWEADSVYIDSSGAAVVISPQPVIFDSDNPAFTSVDASEGDILTLQLFGRPDGSAYWLGTPGGGTVAADNWHAYFIGEANELETWAVAEDDPLPEIVPSIMAFIKGKIINDKGTTITDDLELFNFGPDEGVEPDPPTTEIVLTTGNTHWFYVKLSNLDAVTVTYELANSSSEPDVDTAPAGEKWVILCKVDATTDTYPPDSRSGTKYTITQINEGPIDLRSTGGLFVVRLTNAVSNNEYDAYLQTSSDIATRTDGDAVTAKTTVSLGAALAVGADAYKPAYKEGDYYYLLDVATFK